MLPVISKLRFVFDNRLIFDEKTYHDESLDQRLVLFVSEGASIAFHICEITPQKLRELADLIDENGDKRFVYSLNPKSNGGEALLITFNDGPFRMTSISLHSYGQTATLTIPGIKASQARDLAEQIEAVRREISELNAKKAEV